MNKVIVFGIITLSICMGIQPAISHKTSFFISDDTTPPVTTHTLDPPTPDGDNGWYVSDVTVNLTATDDMSGVMKIKYSVDNGPNYTTIGDNVTFIIDIDKENISIEYWAIDWVGNEEEHHTFYIDMDQTDPVMEMSYGWTGNMNEGYTIIINVTAFDETSNMNRVEFYYNDVLQDTVYGLGPLYSWSFMYHGGLRITIGARAYDNAGNLAYDEIIDPENIHIQQSLKQPTSDIEEDYIECKSKGLGYKDYWNCKIRTPEGSVDGRAYLFPGFFRYDLGANVKIAFGKMVVGELIINHVYFNNDKYLANWSYAYVFWFNGYFSNYFDKAYPVFEIDGTAKFARVYY